MITQSGIQEIKASTTIISCENCKKPCLKKFLMSNLLQEELAKHKGISAKKI